MDRPPVITPTALAGIRLAAGLRRYYIFPTARTISDSDVETTSSMVSSLIVDARKACNIRDYVTLLIEQTIMRLTMDLGPPTAELLAVARFLNPFLVEEGSSSGRLEPFRETDSALVTGPEKDLLVLLYYCHEGNIKGSADEAVKHMASVAGKYGAIKELDTRKEPFTETEVRLHPPLTSTLSSQKSISNRVRSTYSGPSPSSQQTSQPRPPLSPKRPSRSSQTSSQPSSPASSQPPRSSSPSRASTRRASSSPPSRSSSSERIAGGGGAARRRSGGSSGGTRS